MKKIVMEDLSSIRCLSAVAYSPDGKTLAYVVHQASLKENSYLSYIWVMEDGVSRKLTNGGAESSFIWLDNETILFAGDRKNEHKPEPGKACTVYNRINIHGGEAEEFFTVPMKCTAIRRISDEEYLVTGIHDFNAEDITGLEGKEREEAKARIEEEKDYEVID